MKKGMIRVSVVYPDGEGKTFDMDYYLTKHVPLVAELLSEALRGLAIEKGLRGIAPDAPATYVVMGHLYFDTVQAFDNSLSPHAEKIMGDFPKFTNIEPVIQISEVHQWIDGD